MLGSGAREAAGDPRTAYTISSPFCGGGGIEISDAVRENKQERVRSGARTGLRLGPQPAFLGSQEEGIPDPRPAAPQLRRGAVIQANVKALTA